MSRLTSNKRYNSQDGGPEEVALIAETAQSLSRPMGKERETAAAHSTFEKIFLEHYTRVVSVLLRLVGERSRAEELANEVFWRLYRQPWLSDAPGGSQRVAGWLHRTATNLGIDLLRALAKRRRYEEEAARLNLQAEVPADAQDDLLREETRRHVRWVLATLRPAQAQILILRASGCSYQELAEALGLKRGSVGTTLIRAEAEFQKRYVERYGSKEEP